MNMQVLKFVNSESNRWYQLEAGRDLLGDLVVVRRWGGIGSRRGSFNVQVVEDLAAAQVQLDRECARRDRRGYRRS